MPTASERNGSSSSHSSSLVFTLVSSSSVGSSSLCHEVVTSNCEDKDTSIISIVNSQSKNKIRNSGGDKVSILRSKTIQGSKERMVTKKSQPAVKARIRKTCSTDGCANGAKKGGVCWTHGAKKYVYICNHKGCTKKVRKGGVCVTHGAKLETM